MTAAQHFDYLKRVETSGLLEMSIIYTLKEVLVVV